MSKYLTAPSVPGQIRNTKKRVHAIERKLNDPLPFVPGYTAKWSLPGPLSTSESGYEMAPRGGRLLRVWGTLGTPGNSNTVVALRKNGSTFGTLTFPPLATFAEAFTSVEFSPRGDLASVAITSVGTNATGLAVFGEFDH